jgi:hypothetical protein
MNRLGRTHQLAIVYPELSLEIFETLPDRVAVHNRFAQLDEGPNYQNGNLYGAM